MDSRSFADAGVIHHIIFPTQKVEKNHLYKVNSGACKILSYSKNNEKIRSPRASRTSRQLFPGLHALYDAWIRSTNSFCLEKLSLWHNHRYFCSEAALCAECHPKEGGRDALPQDFWKALPLFRVQVG